MSDDSGRPGEPLTTAAADVPADSGLPDDGLPGVGPPDAGLSNVVVHEIRWSDALPWWLLFRAAGASFAPTVFLLAALGCLATWAGWSIADRLGLADVAEPRPAAAAAPGDLVLPAPGGASPGVAAGRPAAEPPLAPGTRAVPHAAWLRGRLPAAVDRALRLVTLPFDPAATLREAGGALARLAWFVLVWSIFGTGIARHVALKLVGEDAPGPVGALWYGATKWLAAFNSVAFTLAGIAALSVPGALLGLAMRTEWGLAIAGAIWPLVLAGAVVLAILAVGVVAGWPLMVAAVGVERGDSFQAISTAFSYLYQRPLHYAFYALVAAAVALPTLAVAAAFADATGGLALWAASFGMGHDRTAAVLDAVGGAAATAPFGSRAIAFWMRCLEGLLASFGWGYAWAIATAAYLLLRRDVDGTEFDEVVLDEPAGAE
jgi:hypothetical protein